MGKLYDRLQKQLKSKEYKKNAEDCLKIYEKLKEMNDGRVWELQWNPLVEVEFKGFLSDDRTYKPSKIGYVFLKGIEENAAPDLLEALKMCWASLQTYGDHPIIDMYCEKAINKALGK